MVLLLLVASLLCLGALKALRAWMRVRSGRRRKELGLEGVDVVGLLHPYANAGGGGERVLWAALGVLLSSSPSLHCVVYTGDTASKAEILSNVLTRFDIPLSDHERRIHFARLTTRKWVEDKSWPRFTMLGQSIGSMWMALDALSLLIPDVYIDTMGYAFTFPIVRFLAPSVPIGAYVHYPTISTNMIRRVSSRTPKSIYYHLFSLLYSHVLSFADYIWANSSWTAGHLDILLRHTRPLHPPTPSSPLVAVTPASPPPKKTTFSISEGHPPPPPLQRESDVYREKGKLSPSPSRKMRVRPRRKGEEREGKGWGKRARVVFPPCDTIRLGRLDISQPRQRIVLSVAQFRPEKDHRTQVLALREFLDRSAERGKDVKLFMAGSVRGEEDKKRVEELRLLVRELELEDNVEFHVNLRVEELMELFGRSSVGLSTMVDEHFGINIVEFMAAGLIPLVHSSGGPLLDLVVPFRGQATGFHASSVGEYAEKLLFIFEEMEEVDRRSMRERARGKAEGFSTERFEVGWMEGWEQLKEEGEKRKGRK
ncbi:glycosyltransferase family 4 protein [Atractiella rhizophila]|nr:glycosyltransferase family 4 protein [Atractiella rhizophila]